MAEERSMKPEDVKRVLQDTARALYVRQGYLKTTLKTVASVAGLELDLVKRYYANREDLFVAALRLPFDPANAITQMLKPAVEGLAERFVRLMLQMFSEPETRELLAMMMRDGAGAAEVAATLREFLETVVVDRLAAVIGVADARMRVALATSYIMGVVVSRYVMRMEPLASASEEKVVRLLVPTVQNALTGAA